MNSDKNVFLTRPLPQPQVERLQSLFPRFHHNQENRSLTQTELSKHVKGADALLCLLNDKIDADIIDSAGPQLRIIANYATGYDNIDIAYATQRGICVTNTPDVLTDATADLAWALLLSVSRRIVEAHEYSVKNRFKGWDPILLLGGEITGKTLGIIGAGRIGTAMAQRSRGWNMPVVYYSNKHNETLEGWGAKKAANLEDLLQVADFISLHVPLTVETKYLINRETLALLKPTAYLINTSRGKVIDEQALVDYLKNKRIAGAGLDVFENEPEIHTDLKELPNVVLAPHIGSATTETRTRMAEMAVDNIVSVLAGNKPPNLVNTEVWK
ncbi:MAG: D-glycerate dehydrogenase [Deferribacteres bacterium]|nr:D-glycerate dehydrogenase [candidate division KSB1 bacterium]MCB9502782.1 D-glycerate dehydrogenase [Deferribacteres bacterium]